MTELIVTAQIRIPQAEFQYRYSRSSGPGGQNVNKVNSKVTLRWSPGKSPSLPDDVRQRFLSQYASRLTNDGELLVVSQRFRDQERNEADCLEKLAAMLRAVAVPPKRRRPTKPTRGAKERRLQNKSQHAQKKRQRRSWQGE